MTTLASVPHSSLPRLETANERLKASFGARLAVSLMLATALHAGILLLWPTMEVELWARGGAATQLIEPLAPVDIPPPPEALRKPAKPVFSTDVDVTETLPVIGWEEAAELPPPPTDPAVEDAGQATGFVPFTVAPRLLNDAEVQRALEREYPSTLKDAGLGGTVTLLVRVGLEGDVLDARVGEGSGYAALDAAALKIAGRMRFSPALNRDKKVAVWISIPLIFEPR